MDLLKIQIQIYLKLNKVQVINKYLSNSYKYLVKDYKIG